MIRCNKCSELKEDNQFATYWHSTQKKMRTRKICRVCILIQKAEYRKTVKERKITQPVQPEPIIDYSLDPNYKQCIKCKEYRTRDNYYKFGTDSRFNTCKICIKKKDLEEREEELIENGGSLKIPPRPNTYNDKYQKELVFEFLPLIGWKFNEENGIWYKSGFKDENGNFLTLTGKKRKSSVRLTNEQRQEIIKLRRKGYKLEYIAIKYGVTKSGISNIVRTYEQKNYPND